MKELKYEMISLVVPLLILVTATALEGKTIQPTTFTGLVILNSILYSIYSMTLLMEVERVFHKKYNGIQNIITALRYNTI